MSNKPPKKSDENKHWRKPRRDRGSRISPEYHLIITEGTKTEPMYFEGLKKAVNQKYTGRIEIVGLGEGANTLTILDKAEKEQIDDLYKNKSKPRRQDKMMNQKAANTTSYIISKFSGQNTPYINNKRSKQNASIQSCQSVFCSVSDCRLHAEKNQKENNPDIDGDIPTDIASRYRHRKNHSAKAENEQSVENI